MVQGPVPTAQARRSLDASLDIPTRSLDGLRDRYALGKVGSDCSCETNSVSVFLLPVSAPTVAWESEGRGEDRGRLTSQRAPRAVRVPARLEVRLDPYAPFLSTQHINNDLPLGVRPGSVALMALL